MLRLALLRCLYRLSLAGCSFSSSSSLFRHSFPRRSVSPKSLSALIAIGMIASCVSLRLVAQAAPAEQSAAASQTAPASPKGLRASEVLALQAGAALPANIAHDISARGLNFAPSAEFVALLQKAGADASVVDAVKTAKVTASKAAAPDQKLLQQLGDAAGLMKRKNYADATAKLSDALDSSFARMETGYVMAELLREQQKYDVALSVYGEILEAEPDFPEVHVKASYLLYRLGDADSALNEAKAALAENPKDAEAHKNAGLALSETQKYDAAIAEYKEALRIKPDYAAVRLDLGLMFHNQGQFADAVLEYKKAIALEPNESDPHNNLAVTYKAQGNLGAAILEYREAKRLNPNDPMVRQNLGSALMQTDPRAAMAELLELEKKFPDFEMCHICLGNGMDWAGDEKGAETEYRLAAKLDPSDPEPHLGLGRIQEKAKNYDAALEEFRAAQKLGGNDPNAVEAVGRLLLEKKDNAGALAELKKGEEISPSSPAVHELYGQALAADGQTDLAIAEFKEAIALDPKEQHTMVELGAALEKKGDWVGAMEQYRKASLTEGAKVSKAQSGESVETWDTAKSYRDAQGRFKDYLVSLKAAGKADQAAELDKRVQTLDTAGGTLEKLQMAMQAGDSAMRERRVDDAEKSFKEAVALAEQLPPGDENLIAALGKLGNVYGMKQGYTDAEAAFHRELTIIEKTFGPFSPRVTDPLFYLGSVAAGTRNYTMAESYFSRALDINLKTFGEKSTRTSESLRAMAGLYMAQENWEKAEPLLVRAVKASEASVGADDNMTLIPLWGLCDLYDRSGKPDQSQPCWHRATEIMAKQYGEDGPELGDSIKNEEAALRRLGRTGEADKLEERLRSIQRTAQK
jgi:tetratricopeptide (TPR) repeat protein